MQKHGNQGPRFLLQVLVGMVVASGGCNPEPASQGTSPFDASAVGSGGSLASGGIVAAGGSVATGGSVSTGGASATGGTGGATGGAMSTDGVVAAAGTIGTRDGGRPDAVGSGNGGNGGTANIGGTTNSGGTLGAGGAGGAQRSSPDSAADAGASKDAGSFIVTPIPDAAAKSDAAQVFWAAAYNANCTQSAIGGRAQTDGHHRPGENCMSSGCHLNPRSAHHHAGTDCRGSGCHSGGSPDGSGAPAFLFGGTVYRAVTLVADSKVEVGVKATEGSYVACSASNGNFWMASSGTVKALTWPTASLRLRNANGEAPMMGAPTGGGCGAASCHTGTMKLTAP